MATETKTELVLIPEVPGECISNIQAATQRTIQLSWPSDQGKNSAEADTEKQCVTVFNGDSSSGKQICGIKDKNVFTGDLSKNLVITYEAPKDTGKTGVKKFEVTYQAVSDTRCTDTPNPPTNVVQSFKVVKDVETIPADLVCAWNISTTANKNLRISLNVNSPSTDSQCVTVSNDDNSNEKKICGKEKENEYVSNGKGVHITFEQQATSLPNFEIFYKYGATSSPFCAAFSLRQLASDHAEDFDDITTRTLKENFYVDDCLVSVDSEAIAVRLVDQLRTLLKHGFRLHKWVNNNKAVLQIIPSSDGAAKLVNLGLTDPEIQRILGLCWRVEEDCFTFIVNLPERPATIRGILSCTASLYDPIGFVAPLLLLQSVNYKTSA
ncbi:unnamed protein product [Echinostoma caproni]|uniref:Reverse transcriptase domain-containing protein n=1 Tax=Echinostoma caproni TaxID=27848 RepID=A0A183AR18_9TREM|nr:unnamed protein product [Echinostoma caproni]